MTQLTTKAGAQADDRTPALEARDITRYYRTGSARARSTVVRAVDGVSLALYRGEIAALVGESGSGKSTVARVLSQLERASTGSVILDGKPVRRRGFRWYRRYARRVQLIFQDRSAR
jgi:peptide/nickel transport system ATP-binding protein